MVGTASCPDAQQWQQLQLGQLPDEVASLLEEHLAGCSSCLEVVRGLTVEDVLFSALRSQAGLAEQPEAEAVRHLVERIKGLYCRPVDERHAETGSDPVSATEESAASTTSAEAVQELSNFLAPAQAPDELGRLGSYRILKVLGSGGMGVVCEAEDLPLRRLVALKVMRAALAARPGARQRFLREARAAATVEHEHIVHINQVGEERGVPFLVMPLLRGESLEVHLQRVGHLPVDEVVRIGREMAEGLAAAHERGLVHRDIKPGNIWLEAPLSPVALGGEGERVKILDFGLARTAEDEGLTLPGVVVGTPAYMAPEQAEGESADARADLFSLGCVLYRMATGRPPFAGKTVLATLWAVVHEQPVPPHELNATLPAALSELVMRLLAKRPVDRPSSASEVAAALEAIASAPPARPSHPTPGRSAGKGCSQLLLAGAVMLLAAVALGGLLAVRLAPVKRRPGSESSSQPEAPLPQTTASLPETQAPQLRRTWKGEVGLVDSVAFSPDGRRLAVAGHRGLKVWDVQTGQEAVALKENRDGFLKVAWRPDGKALAGGGMLFLVKLWDATTGEELRLLRPRGETRGLAYSPDGTRLAAATVLWEGADFQEPSGCVQVWDAGKGQGLLTIPGHLALVHDVAFSPDGGLLAVAEANWDRQTRRCPRGALRVCDKATGHNVCAPLEHMGGIFSVTFSPDGTSLAGASEDGRVYVWDWKTGRQQLVLGQEPERIWSVVYRPDGQVLASTFLLRVQLWSAATGQSLSSFKAHVSPVMCLAFSPDGKLLASGSSDGTVNVWEVPLPAP